MWIKNLSIYLFYIIKRKAYVVVCELCAWFTQYNSSCKQVACDSFRQKLCSVNLPLLNLSVKADWDIVLHLLGNMTGSMSVHTHYEGHEIMFHVSTLLPFSDDPQQVYGKDRILWIELGKLRDCLWRSIAPTRFKTENCSLFCRLSENDTLATTL